MTLRGLPRCEGFLLLTGFSLVFWAKLKTKPAIETGKDYNTLRSLCTSQACCTETVGKACPTEIKSRFDVATELISQILLQSMCSQRAKKHTYVKSNREVHSHHAQTQMMQIVKNWCRGAIKWEKATWQASNHRTFSHTSRSEGIL